mmetsp:Transcript_3667/g.7120  ORF Transcript_3667/g.7120 Transcript_3667/m.7120 type:complete len:238 (-) Transcript_3667:200-913(-)
MLLLAAFAFTPLPPSVRGPPASLARRCVTPRAGQGDELGGAISSTFGEMFASMFRSSAEKEAEIDRAYAEQLEVAERRRNPDAYARKLARTEVRRRKASDEFREKFAWQRGPDPLGEFKRRLASGQIKKLGYDDEPKGGIPMPMASFGVGGEFGVGGKYDNGERFDLRLPFAETGWVDESEAAKKPKGNSWMARLGSKKPPPSKSPPKRRATGKKAAPEPKWIPCRTGYKRNPNWKA